MIVGTWQIFLLMLLIVVNKTQSISMKCPNCNFYVFIITDDSTGTGIQRGARNENEAIRIQQTAKSVELHVITGKEACSSYPKLACGKNSKCDPVEDEVPYYKCSCIEGNYKEVRETERFTCSEIDRDL
ncbi:uncharacterized protein LOC120342825 [Styela clava]|uniref:uncharacterized protein LOC120342825 n=1 Tax=Styela clava TaxID=7725 RepID=UPI001939B214|nr:uncharacterized protein LOC120342825 [Styela clava]XP_039267748.1 uncharacterized protein LOC120342825 [Styela clava]